MSQSPDPPLRRTLTTCSPLTAQALVACGIQSLRDQVRHCVGRI